MEEIDKLKNRVEAVLTALESPEFEKLCESVRGELDMVRRTLIKLSYQKYCGSPQGDANVEKCREISMEKWDILGYSEALERLSYLLTKLAEIRGSKKTDL